MFITDPTRLRSSPFGLLLIVCLSLGQSKACLAQYRVEITPVLHQGDPAPGVPGASVGVFIPPQIDNLGNVWVQTWLQGPDITFDNDQTYYFGPPGALEIVAREGDQAVGLPQGVVYSFLMDGRVAENGIIAFAAELSGPGIVEGVDDAAIWHGPIDDLQLLIQAGDPAPETEPGTVFRANPVFGAGLNDVGDLVISTNLAGPSIDLANDRAIWTSIGGGPLRLVWRESMPVPGTEPGVLFGTGDSLHFNSAGWISIRCQLQGPGITEDNDLGYWVGPAGGLMKVSRDGDQVPGFPDGVTYKVGASGQPRFNSSTDVVVESVLQGKGINELNDRAMLVGPPGDVRLVAQEGDPAPEAGPFAELDSVGVGKVNERKDIMYGGHFRGPGIDDTNLSAVYFGPYDDPTMELRDGMPAPSMDDGILLAVLGGLPSRSALNDVGDAVGMSEISGEGVTDENRTVVWARDGQRNQWVLLLQSASMVAGRATRFDTNESLFWKHTGGGDGQRQSLNDAGSVGLNLEFADGSEGIYRLDAYALGDLNKDGDVDLADFSVFQACFSFDQFPIPPECIDADLNNDERIDDLDFVIFWENLLGAL